MNVRKKAVVAAVLATAGIAASTAIPQAAFAATSKSKVVTRSGCDYKGYLSTTDAYTEKTSGGCSGHAWLAVQRSNGVWSAWIHQAGFVDAPAPSGVTYKGSGHNTCGDCTPFYLSLP